MRFALYPPPCSISRNLARDPSALSDPCGGRLSQYLFLNTSFPYQFNLVTKSHVKTTSCKAIPSSPYPALPLVLGHQPVPASAHVQGRTACLLCSLPDNSSPFQSAAALRRRSSHGVRNATGQGRGIAAALLSILRRIVLLPSPPRK